MLLLLKRSRREYDGGVRVRSNNVRAEMARYGLTGGDVAKALNLTPTTVSRKLQGKREWTVLEALSLVELFNSMGADVTLDDLFGEKKAACINR
jgi:transcriptional regulator with XRE-family HTH domain